MVENQPGIFEMSSPSCFRNSLLDRRGWCNFGIVQIAAWALAFWLPIPADACTLLHGEEAQAVLSAEDAIVCPAEKLPGTPVAIDGAADGKAVPALTGWRTKWRFSREKAYRPDQAYELFAVLKVETAGAAPEDNAFKANIWIGTDSRSALTRSDVRVADIPDDGWHVWRVGGFVSRAGRGEYIYLDRHRGAKTVWISKLILVPVVQDATERGYGRETEYLATDLPGFWLEAARGEAEALLACHGSQPIRLKVHLRANDPATSGALSCTVAEKGRTVQKTFELVPGENRLTLPSLGGNPQALRFRIQSDSGASRLSVLFASPGAEKLRPSEWHVHGENHGTNRAFREAVASTEFAAQRGRLAHAARDRPWLVRTAASTRKLHPKRILSEWEAAKNTGTTLLDLAGNEYESFQLVIIPLAGRSASAKLTVTAQGEVPKPEGLRFSFERVESVYCYAGAYGRLWRGDWPDPLIPIASGKAIPFAGDRLCVVRVTVHAAAGTPSGEYAFRLMVAEDGGLAETLPVVVRVRPFALPPRSSLRTIFYDYPRQQGTYGSLTDFYQLDPLPPEVRQRWREFIARYRVTGAEYNTAPGRWLVDVFREADGSYSFDLERFRQYAKFMIETCHATSVNVNHDCHGWKLFERFPLTDRETGKTEIVHHKLLSPEYERVCVAYLKAVCSLLRQEGWLPYAYFQISDEMRIGLENRARLSKLIRSVEPALKLLGFNSKSADEDLDICVYVSAAFDRKEASARAANGGESWWYVCCSPKPQAQGGWVTNYFIDEVGINHRFHFWQVWERGVQGVLYWGLNHWQYGKRGNIPAHTTRRWPDLPWLPNPLPDINGDGYLVYPGKDMQPWASMRLAIMRDGLEDYEYFHMLDAMIEAAQDRPDAASRNWAKRARDVRNRIATLVREQYDARDSDMIRTCRSEIAETIERGMAVAEEGR